MSTKPISTICPTFDSFNKASLFFNEHGYENVRIKGHTPQNYEIITVNNIDYWNARTLTHITYDKNGKSYNAYINEVLHTELHTQKTVKGKEVTVETTTTEFANMVHLFLEYAENSLQDQIQMTKAISCTQNKTSITGSYRLNGKEHTLEKQFSGKSISLMTPLTSDPTATKTKTTVNKMFDAKNFNTFAKGVEFGLQSLYSRHVKSTFTKQIVLKDLHQIYKTKDTLFKSLTRKQAQLNKTIKGIKNKKSVKLELLKIKQNVLHDEIQELFLDLILYKHNLATINLLKKGVNSKLSKLPNAPVQFNIFLDKLIKSLSNKITEAINENKKTPLNKFNLIELLENFTQLEYLSKKSPSSFHNPIKEILYLSPESTFKDHTFLLREVERLLFNNMSLIAESKKEKDKAAYLKKWLPSQLSLKNCLPPFNDPSFAKKLKGEMDSTTANKLLIEFMESPVILKTDEQVSIEKLIEQAPPILKNKCRLKLCNTKYKPFLPSGSYTLSPIERFAQDSMNLIQFPEDELEKLKYTSTLLKKEVNKLKEIVVYNALEKRDIKSTHQKRIKTLNETIKNLQESIKLQKELQKESEYNNYFKSL